MTMAIILIVEMNRTEESVVRIENLADGARMDMDWLRI